MRVLTALLAVVTLASCNVTRRIPDEEVLYTGVKKFDILTPDKEEKLPSGLVDHLKEAINVAPNDALPFKIGSPYLKSPIPVGLWVYNYWNQDAKGIIGWLYRSMVQQPVLISDVKPSLRVKMLEQILANSGYFGSHVTYSLDYNKKNKKMAKVTYTADVTTPYPIDSIIYIDDKDSPLCHFIDSLARRSDYLRKGEIFNVDSLSAERIRITNRLRNRGYYYFRPEYIEYLADSTITPHKIAVKMTLAANTPPAAKVQYRTGDITTYVLRRSKRRPGTPDTISSPKGDIIVMRPAKLREKLIPECITFRKNKIFSVRDMDRTQNRLSRLGIFSNIQIQPMPADTLGNDPTMNLYIVCQFDNPLEASIEVNATSKSNSYIGPGLTFGLTNHNLFGGGERLSVQLTGSYEWQTGRNRGSVFNSYELGLTGTLSFPRLLAPRFFKTSHRELNWTNISAGADLLNRPHYFKLVEFNAGFSYEWRATRHALSQWTVFKLSYNRLLSTTHEFDSIMAQNPAVGLSFQNQFIPQMSYTYTYDKFFERARINGINFTANVIEGGNIFDMIWRACGVKGEKRLFGIPFSQFIKGQVQLVYNRRLIRGTDHWLVSRILIGAEHAYGNSQEVPYSEQFYIGGANSIRAFTVRSIGPGSYRPPVTDRNGYFDQTGTFKLEMNAEYRFPIVSVLHGAVFLDAGNIWLLKNDPMRPGGKLNGRTFFKDIALGTGVGLRVDIGMMVIRGDLGYGLHTPYSNGTPHYFNIPFKGAFAFHLAIGYPF